MARFSLPGTQVVIGLIAIAVVMDRPVYTSIVDPMIVEAGSSTTVACSADIIKVAEDPNSRGVAQVTLSRKTHFEDKIFMMIYYSPVSVIFGVKSDVLRTQKPKGDSNWTYSYPPWEKMSNATWAIQRENAKVKATVTDVNCQDSGDYICQVHYDVGVAEPIIKEDTNTLDVRGPGAKVEMIAKRARRSRDGGQETVFVLNEDGEITCRGKGPVFYNFYWKRLCPFKDKYVVEWPDESQLEISTVQDGQRDGCDYRSHSQTLLFRMEEDLRDCVVRCDFGLLDDPVTNLSDNTTIRLENYQPCPPERAMSRASRMTLTFMWLATLDVFVVVS